MSREGGGRTRTETGVRSHQEGQGQRDADAHSHETTLPFVGKVVGHVRLYGEREGGGGERETGTKKTPTREGADKSRRA